MKRLGQLQSQPERGQILILTALCLTVVLGVAALSIDASFMYDKRNRLHAAADAAAISAAAEVLRGNTVYANLVNFANHEVAVHGFRPPSPTTVTVDSPPTTGPFANVAGYVRVTTSEVTSTFFGGLLGFQNLTPLASETAGPSPSPNCILALGQLGVISPGLHVGGTINAPDCNVLVNSDLADDGFVTARQTAAGLCSGTCTGNAPYTEDPLFLLPTPPDSLIVNCAGSPPPPPLMINSAMTLDPGKYCGWTLMPGADLTLRAGLYYIAGPITTTPGTGIRVDGTSGVTIYIGPGASIVLDDAAVTMSAPTTGPLRGILFFQERRNSTPAVLGSNADTFSLTGLMYFQGAPLTAKTTTTTDCSVWVAQSMDFTGVSALANTCSAFGGSPLLTVSLAE